MTEHNLPDKDDAPWLELAGLSPQDIEDFRKSKKELTHYAKQKFRKMNNNYIPDDDALEEILHVKLAEERKEELERLRRKETVLRRYNHFYNEEVSGKIGRAHV